MKSQTLLLPIAAIIFILASDGSAHAENPPNTTAQGDTNSDYDFKGSTPDRATTHIYVHLKTNQGV